MKLFNKKKIRVIIIVILSIFLLLPLLYFYYNKFNEYQKEQKELRLQQEAILLEIKEKTRINSLPISKTIYLAIDEKYYDVLTIVNDNNDVLYCEDNYIQAKNIGEAFVYNKNNDEKYQVIVTDLIDLAHIDNYKDKIFEGAYSQEEAEFLDEVLAARINDVGYKTRAAVVEAARFLSMMFQYKIPYFCENGRLTYDGLYCDGEGRYYHQGLYLSEDKFSLLDEDGIINGPQIWGGLMHHSCGLNMQPNGLDCSGFVTWCLVQAGFDPGDYGAQAIYEGLIYDENDRENTDREATWLDELDPNRIQAGDIIGWTGTTAIVVGVDEENIYTAHQYWDNGLDVVTDSKISLKEYPLGEDCGDWQFVTLMDDYYSLYGNGSGKYTAMWQK